MRRQVMVVIAALALPGMLAACERESPGDAQPSPSSCVEHYLAGLESRGEPLQDSPPNDPGELLLYDRLTYRISGEDYMRFAVLRYIDGEQVPEEYRFEEQPELEGTDPLTGVFLYAMWEADCLPPGAVDGLLAELGFGPPPVDRGVGTDS